jgi:DNA (cytosine-5)-methyltransferase 1
VVFLENVKHLLYIEQGKTIKTIIRRLNEKYYYNKYSIINCKFFGVTQSRERLFIVGFRSLEAYHRFSFPPEKEVAKTFKDIIDQGNIEHPLSERWLEYLELYSGRKSLDEISFQVPKTRLKLEKKPKNVPLEDCILQMRSSGIRAIPVTEPFPTFAVSVSGGGAMIPVYVREQRHLNLIEMKRLMGFPDDFVFPVARTHAIKQLANAVPPPVITNIGRKISEALNYSEIKQSERVVLQTEMYQQATFFS